ncbi:hypothetical protein [Loktanella sp. S4079]|uniref:hypothetical protein n=1 Tax=Loktanella sp. S4079 TaxID=579483 RepID=UPI0005FA8CE5|nr:hypothetical protein [Loktanella sp. S4079]KJZ19788.1 hypothetical protein TW80_02550 [Loktanella sp. S4079]
MMPGIGHNSGRVVEPGQSWRKHVWTKARKTLMPTLPIEVVRLRVKRAAELGLPYKTYAGIRASTGHDLIGFMFSTNALQVMRDGQAIPHDRREKLDQTVATARVVLTHRPVSPAYMADLGQIDRAYEAPAFGQSWAKTRDYFAQITRRENVPADRYVLVGDTGIERGWCEAGKLAGYLTAESYFEPQVG